MRSASPTCGIRSNVIVGFPGETDDDLAELESFLAAARLDAVGVFGFSPEDGTEAADLDGQLPADEVTRRVEHINALVEELISQRAEDRVTEQVEVLVESVGNGVVEGRARHQGPEVDGITTVIADTELSVGDIVTAVVEDSTGADLVARVIGGAAR